MKVEMLATASSPEGHLHAGKVYNLSNKYAEELCKPGPNGVAYARKVSGQVSVAEISRPANPEEAEDID